MTGHITIDDTAIADVASEGPTQTAVTDIAYHRLLIVNVIFIGGPDSAEWVLVDAGIPGSAPFIKRAARERFGGNERPVAIIMTHGHFDHAARSKASPPIGRCLSMRIRWKCRISME